MKRIRKIFSRSTTQAQSTGVKIFGNKISNGGNNSDAQKGVPTSENNVKVSKNGDGVAKIPPVNRKKENPANYEGRKIQGAPNLIRNRMSSPSQASTMESNLPIGDSNGYSVEKTEIKEMTGSSTVAEVHKELSNRLKDVACGMSPEEREATEDACPTPDWDKHSCSSLSEVSVACLQDKICQMEETHHSTNEELQATLQELADLQTQLTVVNMENERLLEEKTVLLESLCRQTEKLEDSRSKVDTLQELFLDKSKECCTEREQKLVDFLKEAQEERENLLKRQQDLICANTVFKEVEVSRLDEINHLIERVNNLQCTIDTINSERQQLEKQLAAALEESNSRAIENTRLIFMLDHAKAKIEELEKAGELKDTTDLEQAIAQARKEKDVLEVQVAELNNSLAKSQCEIEKLNEQILVLKEELKVCRNNAYSDVSDLKYVVANSEIEREDLRAQLNHAQELVREYRVKSQCQQKDLEQLKTLLLETQKDLAVSERKQKETERMMNDEIKMRCAKKEEWDQLQADLLVTVRVANDLKIEAEAKRAKTELEKQELLETIAALESQIYRLEAANLQQLVSNANSGGKRNPTYQQDLVYRRGYTRQDSRLSVKSLIESIENATKQAKHSPASRSSSSSSIVSLGGAIAGAMSKVDSANEPACFISEPSGTVAASTQVKLDMKRSSAASEIDPLAKLVTTGGSRRNALLKWCQMKTAYYDIEITNFSSSWNDGMALCALLHTYLPDKIPFETLESTHKRTNFTLAFEAAESVGIPTTLNIDEMVAQERPDWQQVMGYITSIYKHFET